jgi:hypothetical protein
VTADPAPEVRFVKVRDSLADHIAAALDWLGGGQEAVEKLAAAGVRGEPDHRFMHPLVRWLAARFPGVHALLGEDYVRVWGRLDERPWEAAEVVLSDGLVDLVVDIDAGAHPELLFEWAPPVVAVAHLDFDPPVLGAPPGDEFAGWFGPASGAGVDLLAHVRSLASAAIADVDARYQRARAELGLDSEARPPLPPSADDRGSACPADPPMDDRHPVGEAPGVGAPGAGPDLLTLLSVDRSLAHEPYADAVQCALDLRGMPVADWWATADADGGGRHRWASITLAPEAADGRWAGRRLVLRWSEVYGWAFTPRPANTDAEPEFWLWWEPTGGPVPDGWPLLPAPDAVAVWVAGVLAAGPPPSPPTVRAQQWREFADPDVLFESLLDRYRGHIGHRIAAQDRAADQAADTRTLPAVHGAAP